MFLCEGCPATSTLAYVKRHIAHQGEESDKHMSQIGFIGLGIMGKPMARNLLNAGHSLVVYDILPDQVSELVAAGGSPGDHCARAAAGSGMMSIISSPGPE